jgi:hypothetical protein
MSSIKQPLQLPDEFERAVSNLKYLEGFAQVVPFAFNL